MARRRRSGRRGRRSGRRAPFVTRSTMHRDLHGAFFRGRLDPPNTIANPWNSLVVDFAIASPTLPYQLKYKVVKDLIQNQIGLKTAVSYRMAIRFKRVDVWSSKLMEDTALCNIALAPGIICQGASDYYRWVEDRGTLIHPAHCHWVWPIRDFMYVCDSEQEQPEKVILALDATMKDGFNCSIHLHVLWRAVTTDPIPSFRRVLGVDHEKDELSHFAHSVDELKICSPKSRHVHGSVQSKSLLCCIKSSCSLDESQV